MTRKTVAALLRQLWHDDAGAVLTAEYLTLGSVVVLGGVSGLAAMRDSVNDELREYGGAVRAIRTQYAASGFRTGNASHAGSAAADRVGGAAPGGRFAPAAAAVSFADEAP